MKLPPCPGMDNTISYLFAVDRSHVSEIHEGKIGNGTTPATLDFFRYPTICHLYYMPINGIYSLPPIHHGELED